MIYELDFYPDEDDTLSLLLSTRNASGVGGWICTSVVITPPAVRTRYLTIPGRSGVLDYSESLGLAYDNRKITFNLSVPVGNDILVRRRELYFINGKSVRVTSPSTTQDKRIFPASNNTAGKWSFVGRCHLTSCVQNGATLEAVLTLDAFPVARSLNRTTVSLSITSAETSYRYQFPKPGVAQYPPFEITGASVTLYPTAADATANTNGLTLAPGTYSSHPYICVAPTDDVYQYVYAKAIQNASMDILPYVYSLV